MVIVSKINKILIKTYTILEKKYMPIVNGCNRRKILMLVTSTKLPHDINSWNSHVYQVIKNLKITSNQDGFVNKQIYMYSIQKSIPMIYLIS